jgi:hypothetical protein
VQNNTVFIFYHTQREGKKLYGKKFTENGKKEIIQSTQNYFRILVFAAREAVKKNLLS